MTLQVPRNGAAAAPVRTIAAMAALALLSACAPLEIREGITVAARAAAPAFLLEGRISATDGRQAANGGVAWQHTALADHLTLFSPLGQIVARLESSADSATLTRADGTQHTAPDADTLLPELLGIELPVASLASWVQGAPGAFAEVRAHDAAGRPLLVIDQGWRIDYPGYADEGPQALPARIDISRGETRLRLVIDYWTLPQ